MERLRDTARRVDTIWIRDLTRLALLVSCFLLLVTSFAKAGSQKKLVKPGQLKIAGYAVQCGSTPVLMSEQFPDFGAARRGLIILNPVKLKRLSGGARLLIYYHECAHQYVGKNELAADCWAVQKVRREGLMDRAGLKDACSFIESLPGNRRHPPGDMRCRHMMNCYNDAFRVKANTQQVLEPPVKSSSVSSSGFSQPGRTLEHLFKKKP